MELKGNRQLYASPNGDIWSVGRDDAGRLWVRHVPNNSSGGQTSLVDVVTFLAQLENYGPQHNALVQLLASEGHTERQLRASTSDQPLDDKAAKALGAAVVGVWADLPRDIQEALFEAAVQSERHEAFREQLAQFLHDRHPRTVD